MDETLSRSGRDVFDLELFRPLALCASWLSGGGLIAAKH